jgi:hypothetical protein
VNESKIGLHDRLVREGRWSEAAAWKDAKIKELRAAGMKRAEARDGAWQLLAERYPPLPAPEGQAPPIANGAEPEPSRAPAASAGQTAAEEAIDIDALLDRIGTGRSPDLVQDTLWVYENLANPRVKASDAPSCGAWALLQWARTYRNRFFEQVLPRAMLNKSPEDEAHEREERFRTEEIEKILEQFERQAEEETIRRLQQSTSLTIQAKVYEIVKEWEDRFNVPLTDDARTHLQAHFGRFAQTCANVGGGAAVASALPDG